jgi:threonine dehydrogenase-like Zn-dependent dehydrogenase
MRALVLEGSGSIAARNVPAPDNPGECRIRVRLAGICGTDLQMLDGYAAFRGIPGHEFVGVVDAVASPDDERWMNKRVVSEINVGCGRCPACAADGKEHCANRSVVGIRGRDGAFAEFVSVPAANLHEVPDTMDDETAVFVEPTAAACRILEQVTIDAGARVAVLGDGRMGLLVAQVLKTRAPDVTIIGRHEHKLAVARVLDISTQLAAEPVRGGQFDVVVDVTGRPDGVRRALELVRPRGTVVMKSTFHGEAPIESWPIVVNEIALIGSRCGPFGRAIALLASRAVRVKPMIECVAALGDYDSAFHVARRSLKVLFDVRG